MAKFYLEKGLKITQIYKFVKIFPQKCFASLSQDIVYSRRLANTDKSKTVIAPTNELTGNSLYSVSLLSKNKHKHITYHSEDTIKKSIKNSHSIHLDEIKKDIYEVKSLKYKITLYNEALQKSKLFLKKFQPKHR